MNLHAPTRSQSDDDTGIIATNSPVNRLYNVMCMTAYNKDGPPNKSPVLSLSNRVAVLSLTNLFTGSSIIALPRKTIGIDFYLVTNPGVVDSANAAEVLSTI
jgi:hypothetical protein